MQFWGVHFTLCDNCLPWSHLQGIQWVWSSESLSLPSRPISISTGVYRRMLIIWCLPGYVVPLKFLAPNYCHCFWFLWHQEMSMSSGVSSSSSLGSLVWLHRTAGGGWLPHQELSHGLSPPPLHTQHSSQAGGSSQKDPPGTGCPAL